MTQRGPISRTEAACWFLVFVAVSVGAGAWQRYEAGRDARESERRIQRRVRKETAAQIAPLQATINDQSQVIVHLGEGLEAARLALGERTVGLKRRAGIVASRLLWLARMSRKDEEGDQEPWPPPDWDRHVRRETRASSRLREKCLKMAPLALASAHDLPQELLSPIREQAPILDQMAICVNRIAMETFASALLAATSRLP